MSGQGRLRRTTAVWPLPARLMWWVLRPACTLGATAVAVLHAFGGSVLAVVIALAVVLGVRTVGRPWAGLVAAVVAAVAVPVCGILVAARTLVGAVAVRTAGRSWADGLATVRRSRAALAAPIATPDMDLLDADAAWADLADLEHQDEDTSFDTVERVCLTVWVSADARRWARLIRTALGLFTSGRSRSVRLPFDLEFWRLAALEGLARFTARLTAAVLATVLLGLAWSGGLELVGALRAPTATWQLVLAYLATVVAALHLGGESLLYPPDQARRSPTLLVALGVALLVAAGTGAATAAAAVLAAVLVVRRFRPAAMASVVGRPPRRGKRLPWPAGTRRGRATWRAADEARRNTTPYEAALWTEIVDDEREQPALRAGAAAALTEIALDASDLQAATRWADRSLAFADAGRCPPAIAASVWAAAGRTQQAVGNSAQAVALLDRALSTRAYRDDPVVATARRDAAAGGGGRGRMISAMAREVAEAARARDVPRLKQILQLDLDDPEVADGEARREMRTVSSRGYLELGSLQLDTGEHAAAVASLRKATTGLDRASTTIEHAVARILLGAACSHVAPGAALPELAAGVRMLEQRRGALSAGRHRGNLVVRYAQVYAHLFRAATVLSGAGIDAAPLAGEVAESLRRGALASLLRSGPLDLPRELVERQREIAELEDRDEQAVDGELERLRAALADGLSAVFAATYVPAPVRFDDLRRRATGAHVLTYHLHQTSLDAVAGHVVWTPQVGSPVVAQVSVTEPDLLALVGVAGDDVRSDLMDRKLGDDLVDRWTRLGTALLPGELAAMLTALPDGAVERIVVVPHGLLAALPWPALRLGDGRPLIRVAELQLVPSLALLEEESPFRGSHRLGSTVLVHLAEPASAPETRMLATLRTTVADTRDGFVGALSDEPDGAYLAAHGTGEGLHQAVTFRGGEDLSAASALGLRWPQWVMFASCLVGRVDLMLGDEPLGLPVSCMLGGAETVIGGVIEVGYTVGRQAAALAARLSAGADPVPALRAAQIAQLDRGERAPLTSWASLACISRRAPSGL